MDAQFFDPNRAEDDFKITINRQGQWFHDGREIARDKLVKLFATALHYDSDHDEYWLVTPHEQGRVHVEDAPYIIVDFDWQDHSLTLTSNLDHIITPNAQQPIFLKGDIPYSTVHNNNPARLNRHVREKLIDIALAQGGYDDQTQILTLKANGHDHPVARS